MVHLNVVSVEKHARNKLKGTKVKPVPAIRTGQGHCQVSVGPDPDGWETLK